MNKFPAFRSQCECMCVFLSACVCVRACELVAGIKDVMQDYPAGRLPTSTAEEEEEMARQRGSGRQLPASQGGGVYEQNLYL